MRVGLGMLKGVKVIVCGMKYNDLGSENIEILETFLAKNKKTFSM